MTFKNIDQLGSMNLYMFFVFVGRLFFSGENRRVVWTSFLESYDHPPDDTTSEGISPKEVSRENPSQKFSVFSS